MGNRLAVVVVVFFIFGVLVLCFRFLNQNTDKIKPDKESYLLAKKKFKDISFEGKYISISNVDSDDLIGTEFYYKNCNYVVIELMDDSIEGDVPPYFEVKDKKLFLLFSKKNGLTLYNGNTNYSLVQGMKVSKKKGDMNITFIKGNEKYEVLFLRFLEM